MSALDIMHAAKKEHFAAISMCPKSCDEVFDVSSLRTEMQQMTEQIAGAGDCDNCDERDDNKHGAPATMTAPGRALTALEQARLAIAEETHAYHNVRAAASSYAAVVARHWNTTEGRLRMMKAYEDAIKSEVFAQLGAEYKEDEAQCVGFLLAMHSLLAQEGHRTQLDPHYDCDMNCIPGNGILSSASKMAQKGMDVASSGIKTGAKAVATAAGHSLEFAAVAASSFS